MYFLYGFSLVLSSVYSLSYLSQFHLLSSVLLSSAFCLCFSFGLSSVYLSFSQLSISVLLTFLGILVQSVSVSPFYFPRYISLSLSYQSQFYLLSSVFSCNLFQFLPCTFLGIFIFLLAIYLCFTYFPQYSFLLFSISVSYFHVHCTLYITGLVSFFLGFLLILFTFVSILFGLLSLRYLSQCILCTFLGISHVLHYLSQLLL